MATWLDSWTTAKNHPGSQGFVGKCDADTVQKYLLKCVAPILGEGGTRVARFEKFMELLKNVKATSKSSVNNSRHMKNHAEFCSAGV